MQEKKVKPKPFLVPEYCKGCGRCVSVCVKGCIAFANEINPTTGLVPVVLAGRTVRLAPTRATRDRVLALSRALAP